MGIIIGLAKKACVESPGVVVQEKIKQDYLLIKYLLTDYHIPMLGSGYV